MKFLIPLLICIPLAFLNCERNRVSPPPAQQHTPPAQHTPIPTPAPPTQQEKSCYYLSRPIIFGDASCSRMFCYTPGWCAGHGTVFMFCEAYRDLNDTTKVTCPSAATCAMAETVPSHPGIAPHLWNRCSGSGGNTVGSSGETETEDDSSKTPQEKNDISEKR